MHALSDGQSELITHSGLQLGGEPIISGRQEQSHLSPICLGGLLLGPQGFGLHGSTSAIIGSTAKNKWESNRNGAGLWVVKIKILQIKRNYVIIIFGSLRKKRGLWVEGEE